MQLMKEKIEKCLILIIIIGGLFALSNSTFSHPGRTDASGCHTCRTNCPSWGLSYGEYHCHRAKTLPQPEPPIKSHRGYPEGYTEPAPEYEQPLSQDKPPTSEKYTAEIPKETSDGSVWGWIIGLGIAGYIFYLFKRRKK